MDRLCVKGQQGSTPYILTGVCQNQWQYVDSQNHTVEHRLLKHFGVTFFKFIYLPVKALSCYRNLHHTLHFDQDKKQRWSLLIDCKRAAIFKRFWGKLTCCRGPTEVTGMGGRGETSVFSWQALNLAAICCWIFTLLRGLFGEADNPAKKWGLRACECAYSI